MPAVGCICRSYRPLRYRKVEASTVANRFGVVCTTEGAVFGSESGACRPKAGARCPRNSLGIAVVRWSSRNLLAVHRGDCDSLGWTCSWIMVFNES